MGEPSLLWRLTHIICLDLRFCVKPTNFNVGAFNYDVSDFQKVTCGTADIALSTDDSSVNTIDFAGKGTDGLGAMTILILESYLETGTRKLSCKGTAFFTATRKEDNQKRVLRVHFGDEGRALQEAPDAQADFGFTVDIAEDSASSSVSLVASAMAAALSAIIFFGL